MSEPEKFLLDKLDGIVEYVLVDYPNRIFYKKNDIVLFEYHQTIKYLYYSYDYIRVVFLNKFSYNYHDTCSLVEAVVGQHLKLKINVTKFG